LLHYLAKFTKPKMHMHTNSAFKMLTIKEPLNASNYIDSFVKCCDESYK